MLSGLALCVVEGCGHGDDGIGDFLAEIVLGNLLHLGEQHGRDLLGEEAPRLALVAHLNARPPSVAKHAEWPLLEVALDVGVFKKTSGITTIHLIDVMTECVHNEYQTNYFAAS